LATIEPESSAIKAKRTSSPTQENCDKDKP
jgi:hypothetical protein